MPVVSSIRITGHTTSSTPDTHILYIIQVTQTDGSKYEILRRYSEFLTLHDTLGAPFVFPAKQSLKILLVPFTWVNDELIYERKKELSAYMYQLVQSKDLQHHPRLHQFLTPGPFPQSGDTTQTETKSNINTSLLRRCDPMEMVHTEKKDSGLIAATYYPSWAGTTFPPHKIDFSKFDIIFFAFMVPNGNAGLDWDDKKSQNVLRQLVSAARSGANKTRIVLSIGGWNGCYWFSQAVSSTSNRTKLCEAVTHAIKSFGLDGVDIDWEYPNDPGAGNPFSPSDAANLLSLVKLLRGALGNTRIISSAVTHLPWKGADGSPMRSVAEFAKYMNFVNIMNYDVFASSGKPGPNAPLDNRCGTSSQPQATAKAALAQWTQAGMPASKLLLGMPLYGYVSRSSADRLSGSYAPELKDTPFPVGAHPRFKMPDVNTTLAPMGDLSHMWGQQIPFNQLLTSGVLRKKPDGTYDGANGYRMAWDHCSDTPGRSTVVTYDDTWSLMDKAKFVKESGMAGCFTWSIDQDDGIVLHNVIRTGLGKN